MSEFTKEEIKNMMGATEDYNCQVLKTMRINSDEAYERLKIVRKAHKELGEALNKLTRDMPYTTRTEYEQMFILLENLEKSELENVRFGE